MSTFIRAQSTPWRSGIELYIGDREGKTRVAQIIMEKLPDDAAACCPVSSLQMSNAAAQTLMDDLWQSGLRPTEGTGSAGSLAATERHLADMRALVFKTEPKP
jgi:hypothetical protein